MLGRSYFSWEQAVAKEKIQPQTKLVLYIILNYNTVSGPLILPDISVLIADSGLPRDVFTKHLKKAYKHGFTELTSGLLEKIHE